MYSCELEARSLEIWPVVVSLGNLVTPNINGLSDKACSRNRIGRVTQLKVHPPSLSILSFCLCLLNIGASGTSSFNTGE